MLEKEYTVKYKHKGAINTLVVTFSDGDYLSSLRLVGTPSERKLPLYLERIREFFNTPDFNAQAVSAFVGKIPYTEYDLQKLLDRIIKDLFNLRSQYKMDISK